MINEILELVKAKANETQTIEQGYACSGKLYALLENGECGVEQIRELVDVFNRNMLDDTFESDGEKIQSLISLCSECVVGAVTLLEMAILAQSESYAILDNRQQTMDSTFVTFLKKLVEEEEEK